MSTSLQHFLCLVVPTISMASGPGVHGVMQQKLSRSGAFDCDALVGRIVFFWVPDSDRTRSVSELLASCPIPSLCVQILPSLTASKACPTCARKAKNRWTEMERPDAPFAAEGSLFMDYEAMHEAKQTGANVNYAGLIPLAWSIGGCIALQTRSSECVRTCGAHGEGIQSILSTAATGRLSVCRPERPLRYLVSARLWSAPAVDQPRTQSAFN